MKTVVNYFVEENVWNISNAKALLLSTELPLDLAERNA